METYYTVYKVTNKVNGKVYVGCHKTKNLDDGYMGSGKYLKRSMEKHGIEKFEKEILHVFDNPEDMFAKEGEIVNEDFLAEENTYNLKVGGEGGFDYINRNGHTNKGKDYNKISEQAKERWSNMSANEKKELISKMIVGRKRKYKSLSDEERRRIFGGMKGKHHSDETKRYLSVMKKGVKTTSTLNKQWFYSEKLRKNILVGMNEDVPDGFVKGRVQNWNAYFHKKDREARREEENRKLEVKRKLFWEDYYHRLCSSGLSLRKFSKKEHTDFRFASQCMIKYVDDYGCQ